MGEMGETMPRNWISSSMSRAARGLWMAVRKRKEQQLLSTTCGLVEAGATSPLSLPRSLNFKSHKSRSSFHGRELLSTTWQATSPLSAT